MKYIISILILLAGFAKPVIIAQNIDFEKSDINLPDNIAKAKFKNGYTKFNPKGPKKYQEISEEKAFFGGRGYKHIKNINLDVLLSRNDTFVYIPTGSYIVLEFKDGITDVENSPDLIVESCSTPCGCGKLWQDSALVSASYGGRKYFTLGYIKTKENRYYDFNDYQISEPVHFIKIEGATAINVPYGFELMNVIGLKSQALFTITVPFGPADYSTRMVETFIIPPVLFEHNDSTLKPEAHLIINTVYNRIIETSPRKIIIKGYTDASGSESYNLKLSLSRANSVKKSLISRGINASMIEAKGFGEKNLIIPQDRLDFRNRRVEIELVHKK